MFKKFNHYSTSIEWIETKAQFTKWSLYKGHNNISHLYLKIFRLISFHWLSYLEKEELEKRIENILKSKNKIFINVFLVKLINKDLKKLEDRYSYDFQYFNKNIFVRETKSSLKSDLENFFIDLKYFSENSLTKNWRRNLKRSEKKGSKFTYKFLNPLNNIDEIYSVIIKNAKLKRYKYPYSKNFLKGIFNKSIQSIVCIGAYNQNKKLVAIRAYYMVEDTAIDFIAAALPEALKYYITYKVAFKLLTDAKEKGNNIYNLGGVDFIMNKGVYNFKKGLGGELKSDGKLILGLIINKNIPKIISKILLKIFSCFF